MKMDRWTKSGAALLLLAALGFGSFQIVRYPASFRTLVDRSLPAEETEAVRRKALENPERKVLVAYFSYSGTTGQIAEEIRKEVGGDLYDIRKDGGYAHVYLESNWEIMRNEHPPLKGELPDMSGYDVIFVGYPVWWHATPAPISTFLADPQLKGKLIIPFCTSVESGIGETMPTFLDAADGLAVYDGRRLRNRDDVKDWIQDLQL